MKIKKKFSIAIIFVVTFAASIFFAAEIFLKSLPEVKKLRDGLYFLDYKGNYGFAEFLEQGGAASDEEMAEYIESFLNPFAKKRSRKIEVNAGCSAISAVSPDGKFLAARNYDWEKCGAIIVRTSGTNAYSSISTCCYDFLGFGPNWKPDSIKGRMLVAAAIYVPLDGMNEKGLFIADLMAGDDEATSQDSGKLKLTTVSAIRYVLDYAATVDEAVALLENCDMNSSIASAHHYAISDALGNAVVVEYVGGNMIVTESPFVTNHYLAKEKFNVGVVENPTSLLRFEHLQKSFDERGGIFSEDEITKEIRSVTKSNFPAEGWTTEWTVVYNKSDLRLAFYRQEDFETKYEFSMAEKK